MISISQAQLAMSHRKERKGKGSHEFLVFGGLLCRSRRTPKSIHLQQTLLLRGPLFGFRVSRKITILVLRARSQLLHHARLLDRPGAGERVLRYHGMSASGHHQHQACQIYLDRFGTWTMPFVERPHAPRRPTLRKEAPGVEPPVSEWHQASDITSTPATPSSCKSLATSRRLSSSPFVCRKGSG